MDGYMKREQSIKRIENIKKVLEYFNSNGGTILEIAKALKMTTSSVQRYLNASKDPEIRKIIKDYLEANKKEGNKKGGKTTQQKHGYQKDESGHFNGIHKK